MPKLPITGNIAKGEDFYGREKEMQELWRLLDRAHVLLLAPRRVGKSSIMERLAVHADRHRFEPIQQSVAGCQDELTFVRDLYRAVATLDGTFLQRLGAKPWAAMILRHLPKEASVGPVGITFGEDAAAHWRDLGSALVRTLAEHGDKKYLFLLDELPLFVLGLMRQGGVERARPFLEWFRDVRQQLDNVRWLLAGSIGLDGIAASANLSSTINDLHRIHLGAFEPGEADGFLVWSTERAGYSLSDETRVHLLARVGWAIPFFLAHFVYELSAMHLEGATLDVAAVDLVFERLTSVEQRSIYGHWNERLDLQLTADKVEIAHAMLETIALDPNGVGDEALLASCVDPRAVRVSRAVLNDLEADGYVVRDREERWRFRSPLLRTYWQRFVCGRKS